MAATEAKSIDMTDLEIVEGIKAQNEYEKMIAFIYGYEDSNKAFIGISLNLPIVFFYKVEVYPILYNSVSGWVPSDFEWCNTSLISTPTNKGREFIEKEIGTTCGWKLQYNLYRFYTNTGIFVYREFHREEKRYLSIENNYRCSFGGKSCILSIDDFTEDFKKSRSPIEIQLGKMVEMNNIKHQTQTQFEEKVSNQVSQMNEIILRMQSQIEQQSKIISQQQSKIEGMKKIMTNMLREQQSTKSVIETMQRQIEEQSKMTEHKRIDKSLDHSTLESDIEKILNGDI